MWTSFNPRMRYTAPAIAEAEAHAARRRNGTRRLRFGRLRDLSEPHVLPTDVAAVGIDVIEVVSAVRIDRPQSRQGAARRHVLGSSQHHDTRIEPFEHPFA